MALKSVGSIVMEKDTFLRDMLAVVPGPAMAHTTASTSQLDGLALAGTSTAPPLPLTAPSGVSRPQFLVAAQAASLPCFPAYCAQHGGAVLDRQLLHVGAEHWWSTLTSRLKLQRLLTGRKAAGWSASLSDPTNYALCHTTFMRLPQQAVLKTKLAYMPQPADGSTRAAAPEQPLHLWGWQLPAGVSKALRHRRHMSAAASFRRKLKNSEIRVDAAVNQQGVEPGAWGSPLPLQVAVDVRSPPTQLSRLQYRLGVQHLVTCPATQRAQASTHLHAALGVQGHRCLWSGKAASRRAINMRKRTAPGPATRARHSAADGAPGGAAAGAAAAAAGGNGSSPPRGKVLGPHNPIRQVLQRLLRGPGDAQQPLEQGSDAGEGGRAGRAAAVQGLEQGLQGLLGAVVPPPEEMQELVMDATQSIKRLREDVQSLADYVSSGSFTQQLEQQLGIKAGTGKPRGAPTDQARAASSTKEAARPKPAAPAPKAAPPAAPASLPWSSLVGAPHLKVAGLMGMYLRQPLLTPGADPQEEGSAAGRPSQPGGEGGGSARLVARANSVSADLIRSSVTWLMNAAGSLVQQEQQHAQRGAGGRAPKLGAFASVAASAQLGWMQRPLLDFTRATARLDMGLLGQPPLYGAAGGSSSSGAGSQPRDWAWLHGPLPCWHALTLSFSQQLVGPLRLCADARYALELGHRAASPRSPTHPGAIDEAAALQSSASIRMRAQQAQQVVAAQLQGAAEQVRGVRPQLVDAAVALDCVLPGSGGFGRVVAWYAPLRKEGMLELRLL